MTHIAPAPRPNYYGTRSRFAVREHDHRADDQTTKRERRRKHLSVVYDEQFVLSHEVAAILDTLPAQVMANPLPRCIEAAAYVGDAMQTILTTIASKVALAPAPEFAELTPDALTSGTWAVALVNAAQTVDGPLAKALAGGGKVNGQPRDEALLGLLRELDQAARNLAAGLRNATRPVPDTYAGPSAERVARDQMARRHADELAALRARHRAERQALRHG
ncbi:hypothetical protein ACFVH4_13770 [Nocardia ignorata]|uniref:hypothetical protein n=1 Tax=Nocardia ignorata TaxID=145285 RepID=UPI00362E02D2